MEFQNVPIFNHFLTKFNHFILVQAGMRFLRGSADFEILKSKNRAFDVFDKVTCTLSDLIWLRRALKINCALYPSSTRVCYLCRNWKDS